jgi:hypothetical protein
MKDMRRLNTLGASLLALSILSVGNPSRAQAPASGMSEGDRDGSPDNDTALAKKLQNPIGDLYSFPFQNNTNFNYGPHKGTQDILNVQPVIPIHINEDWNIITRTILPLIWQPSLQPAQTVPFGTGPTTFSAFLSPSQPVNGWLWALERFPITLKSIPSERDSLRIHLRRIGPAVCRCDPIDCRWFFPWPCAAVL